MKADHAQQSCEMDSEVKSEEFNLTAPQAAIWLDWNKGRDPSSYNICNVIQFDGELDVDMLWQAVVQADRENDALRLRFSNSDGKVAQSFAQACRPTDFGVVDLRYTEDAELAAFQEIAATRTRLLDPEEGYLCRHRLLRLSEHRYWWVRVYHHLVIDGFAGHLLAERVSEIYRALRSGAPIPECSFRSYQQFIESDARYPESPSYGRDLAYWKERLKDDRAVTRFAAFPDAPETRHTQYPQTLSNAELDAINAAAKACGASPASLMMAIFAALLGGISGESHPILTLSLLNRIGRDERNMPGAFSCVMPFDIDLEGHQRISELAKDIFTRARRDVRHIRFGPVRMRSERLGPKSLAGGGAFFNSLDSMTPLDFDGPKTKRMNMYNAPVNDLGLVYFVQAVSESENEAELIWQYNANRLSQETVERIAERFRRLLNRVIADPEQDISVAAESVAENLDELHLGRGDEADPAAQYQAPHQQVPEKQAAPSPSASFGKLHERQLAEKIKRVWSELIESDDIPADANLFEVGAHSLIVPRAQFALSKLFGREVAAVEIFEHPSINAFARHVLKQSYESPIAAEMLTEKPLKGAESSIGDIAVVGMGLRLPGAADRDSLWSLLESGTDMVRALDATYIDHLGGDSSQLENRTFVARHSVLEDIDSFDANLFSMTEREARETDPQQRLLLETALTALEDSGCAPDQDGPVGVYVGVGFNSYFMAMLAKESSTRPDVARYGLMIANDKDYAATRLAYKLNLTGPALSTSTACSTGLVNIALAVQALRAGQCRVALAGSASLGLSPFGGYYFTEGGIGSRSGICRPFDHKADGVVGASGGAVVVLKRLSDAIADKDTIHGVIKGVGLVNDGMEKAAFSAPTVEGQARAIRAALADANVSPESIRFVEGHGTGTPLGDPIEVSALNRVFGKGGRPDSTPIWLGSIKGNFGHLDAAAGMAGFIKALLALKHRTVPPTCHFESPNPQIPLDDGPFQINKSPVALADHGATPMRAGVSSFGIGGTNAHVVLEAAPERETIHGSTSDPVPYFLRFSAASPASLKALLARTSAWLSHKGARTDIRDLAFSLSRRRQYPFRAAIIAETAQSASHVLADEKSPRHVEGTAEAGEAVVAFLFPGQGAQRPGMARALYKADTESAELIDQACATVERLSGPGDLHALLLAASETPERVERLAQTDHAQPALFIFEYALAQFLMARGVQPAALAGHSIGEYVAACLAGVMSFDDALRLVVVRSRLMATTNPGAMYALPLGEADVGQLLGHQGSGLSIAAINSPRQCVVSGPDKSIDELDQRLQREGKTGRRLVVSRAFHSHLMDPVLEEFHDVLTGIELSTPKIPLQSNLTGDWLRDAEAIDPDYWVRHMRNPVRFADNITRLHAAVPDVRMVDCGPGDTACRLAMANGVEARHCIATQPGSPPSHNAREDNDGVADLLAALGRMWVQGVELDFEAVLPGETAQRIPVPTYVFDRQRYWLDSLGKEARFSSAGDLRPSLQGGDHSPSVPEEKSEAYALSAEQAHLSKVLGVWHEMFGNPCITADQDFFELGGDSLLAVQIASRLSEAFEREVPVSVMIEYKTPEAVAMFLAKHERLADLSMTETASRDLPKREHGAL